MLEAWKSFSSVYIAFVNGGSERRAARGRVEVCILE
jgi:hypothetical protein